MKCFVEHLEVTPMPTSGSLNIVRSEMPQIASEHIDAFIRELQKDGYDVVRKKENISHLRPTQREINPVKVQAKAEEFKTGKKPKPFIISSDFHILDGHHQWAALKQVDPHTLVDVIQVDLPMDELLLQAHNFDKVFYKDIHEEKIRRFKQFS